MHRRTTPAPRTSRHWRGKVLAVPALARLTALKRHTAVGEDGRRYPLVNGNVLIDLVPGMTGVKTGYTRRAGRCLVGSVERDGHRVLVVVLGGTDRWWTWWR